MWRRFKEYVVAVAPVIARTLVLSTASLVVSDGLRRAGILLARRVLESLPGGVWSGTQLTAFVPFLSSPHSLFD